MKENLVVKVYFDLLFVLSVFYFVYFRLWDDLNILVFWWVCFNLVFYKLFVLFIYYEVFIKEIFEIKWSLDMKIMIVVDLLYMGKCDFVFVVIY